MQKVISFSIAAYNIEVYAKQLLDSFIDEKTMDEIEVLIINDGSNDQTVNICQEYVNKYPNVFRLINKENGGHGSTINKGIKIAKGKYFKPIDGDDWIKTTNLPKIIKIIPSMLKAVLIRRMVYSRLGSNLKQLMTLKSKKDSRPVMNVYLLWYS